MHEYFLPVPFVVAWVLGIDVLTCGGTTSIACCPGGVEVGLEFAFDLLR